MFRKILFAIVFGVLFLACAKDKMPVQIELDQELQSLIKNASPTGDLEFYILPDENDLDSIPQDQKNLLTSERVELGKLLYFETGFAMAAKKESGKGTYSCASCHVPEAGFRPGSFQGIADGGMGFGIHGEDRRRHPDYIESELDEDFNVTEVLKTKKVNVTGFSLYMSTNKNGRSLVNKLSNKGILTRDGAKYRLLYSPPLNMKITDTSLALYTSKYLPNMVMDTENQIIWTNKSTPYTVKIDSTSLRSIYGSLTIPLHKLVEENVPLRQK